MLTATYIKKHMTNYLSLCVDFTRMILKNYSIFGLYVRNFMDNF